MNAQVSGTSTAVATPSSSSTEFHNDTLYHIVVCDTFHIFALVLLAAAMLTAFVSPRVPRTPTWFLLISSATLGTGSRILIIGQQMGLDPNRAVCVVQAMLLTGTAVLNIYTGAAFVLQIYLTLLAIQKSWILRSAYLRLMHAVPICVFFGTLLAVLLVGTQQSPLIRRSSSGMYCELEVSSLDYSLTGVGLLGILMTVSVKVLITINLLSSWKKNSTEHLLTRERTPPSTIARAFGYTFILFVIFILGIASYFPSDENMLTKITDIVISVGAAATAVVFATESDIIKVWFFWRKPQGLDTSDLDV